SPLLCVALLLAATTPVAAAPDDLDDLSLRKLLEAPLGFKPCVFTGETFPACNFGDPAGVEKLLGPHKITAVVHDAEARVVPAAKEAGPYFAVVTVTPEKGRPMRRHITLYRAAKTPADTWRFDA